MQWRLRSKRAPSGKLLKKNMKKKRYMRGRDFLPAHIGTPRVKPKRTRSGNAKLILLSSDVANVMHKGKSQKAKIVGVLKNDADPQLVRRSVITKGAIIQTELGEARVTSRPGQDGAINAVLLEKKGAK